MGDQLLLLYVALVLAHGAMLRDLLEMSQHFLACRSDYDATGYGTASSYATDTYEGDDNSFYGAAATARSGAIDGGDGDARASGSFSDPEGDIDVDTAADVSAATVDDAYAYTEGSASVVRPFDEATFRSSGSADVRTGDGGFAFADASSATNRTGADTGSATEVAASGYGEPGVPPNDELGEYNYDGDNGATALASTYNLDGDCCNYFLLSLIHI